MSAGSDAGSQRSRSVVKARRAQAYSMYLRGFNERQIAESLHVKQSTVSRALAAKRKENAEWLVKNDGENLLRSFFQEERDRYLDLLQEEWNYYYDLVKNGSKGQTQALNMIRATLGSMSHMEGRLVKELDAVQTRKELDELEKYVELSKEKESNPHRPPNSPN
jgi:predicted transcriptional regulator